MSENRGYTICHSIRPGSQYILNELAVSPGSFFIIFCLKLSLEILFFQISDMSQWLTTSVPALIDPIVVSSSSSALCTMHHQFIE